MSNGTAVIVYLIVGLIKKIWCDSSVCLKTRFLSYMFKTRFNIIKMSQYFPKPHEAFSGNIKVKVDLSNYATKADIKNISHADTSSLALKTNLVNLKTEVDKLNIYKLVPVPVDLSKLML